MTTKFTIEQLLPEFVRTSRESERAESNLQEALRPFLDDLQLLFGDQLQGVLESSIAEVFPESAGISAEQLVWALWGYVADRDKTEEKKVRKISFPLLPDFERQLIKRFEHIELSTTPLTRLRAMVWLELLKRSEEDIEYIIDCIWQESLGHYVDNAKDKLRIILGGHLSACAGKRDDEPLDGGMLGRQVPLSVEGQKFDLANIHTKTAVNRTPSGKKFRGLKEI